MSVNILLSTAYLPPVEYFALIAGSSSFLIEKEENYTKQSYRNRCYILSAHGPLILSVPAMIGDTNKTLIKDIRIDYSKRWQQVHLRALMAAYRAAPYFEFYFGEIEAAISKKHNYLIDLNSELTEMLLKMLKIDKKPGYTGSFIPLNTYDNDYRYCITPKNKSSYSAKEYMQVFENPGSFSAGLSIVDLIFNMGPESATYL
jgi:hypothetical protein